MKDWEMSRQFIAVIAGDGIGNEVIPEGGGTAKTTDLGKAVAGAI